MTGDVSDITKMLKSLERERKELEADIVRVVYYMNGAINLNDAYVLSTEQFELLITTIKTHFENQSSVLSGKKTG
jgi:hypothetical protein